MVFSVVTYGCESWTIKKAERRTDAFKEWFWKKTPESPLDSKEIKAVNPEGNQPWMLTGRTNAKAETPVFWSSDANSCLIGKVPDAGKDWGQKEKRASEDERAGWHHRCNWHELRKILAGGEGQRGLACCSPWGRKETRLNNWTDSFLCDYKWDYVINFSFWWFVVSV